VTFRLPLQSVVVQASPEAVRKAILAGSLFQFACQSLALGVRVLRQAEPLRPLSHRPARWVEGAAHPREVSVGPPSRWLRISSPSSFSYGASCARASSCACLVCNTRSEHLQAKEIMAVAILCTGSFVFEPAKQLCRMIGLLPLCSCSSKLQDLKNAAHLLNLIAAVTPPSNDSDCPMTPFGRGALTAGASSCAS